VAAFSMGTAKYVLVERHQNELGPPEVLPKRTMHAPSHPPGGRLTDTFKGSRRLENAAMAAA